MIPQIDGAKDRAYLYLTELQQAVDVRQLFIDIVIGRLGELRGCFQYDKVVLSRLDDALRLKGTSASALYRGLFIQANSIFEA